MKNKLVLLSLLLAGTTTVVSAQTKEKSYSESWKDNIFISVGAGVQGTTNPDSKFGKNLTPLINVSVGKFVTPVWGFRGQVYGWSSKMETNYPFESLNAPKVERKENYIGINLDGTLNLTNLFCGYKPGRVFELNFFAGPSMNVVKNYCHWDVVYSEHKTVEDGHTVIKKELDYDRTRPTGHELRCLVGASLGLGAKFNINPKWAIDVEARGQVTPSVLGAYSSGNTDGYLHLTAGATYTFGGKKFVSCSSKVDQNAINDELNKYRDELATALKGAKAVAIMDRTESYNGNGGPLGSEVTAGLFRNKVMIDTVNYIYGLAGRDFTVQEVYDIFADLEDHIENGTKLEQFKYIGLR